MTFEQWIADYEFWKASTEAALRAAWVRLEKNGVPGDTIALALDDVMTAMMGEYGE